MVEGQNDISFLLVVDIYLLHNIDFGSGIKPFNNINIFTSEITQ